MTCYRPLSASLGQRKPNGKLSITFGKAYSKTGKMIDLPCGQCIGCRLDRSGDWAARCVLEASQYEKNSFITLTYNDENLPKDKSLHLEHFQAFMRKLRKKTGEKIRFYHAGEYGEVCKSCGLSRFVCKCDNFYPSLGRPHYHALLFNYDFDDKVFFFRRNEVDIYRSQELESIWKGGYSTVGDLSFKSAGYVARYALKKVTGKMAESYYQGKKPEYSTMSRRPGIAANWYERYKKDVYPEDKLVLTGGVLRGAPRFFDNKLEKEDNELYNRIKEKREKKASENWKERCLYRLISKEFCKNDKANKLKREMEIR